MSLVVALEDVRVLEEAEEDEGAVEGGLGVVVVVGVVVGGGGSGRSGSGFRAGFRPRVVSGSGVPLGLAALLTPCSYSPSSNSSSARRPPQPVVHVQRDKLWRAGGQIDKVLKRRVERVAEGLVVVEGSADDGVVLGFLGEEALDEGDGLPRGVRRCCCWC